MNYKKESRVYDKIAANRISKINGGIDLHVAIGSRHSITLRNKMKRLGLDGEHIEDLLKMVDEIAFFLFCMALSTASAFSQNA